MIEMWRKIWREGVEPLLSDESLAALLKALRDDDPRLAQGMTTEPPPLQCLQDWEVEKACPIAFCGWIGDGLSTVGEVETYFARMCYEIDLRLFPTACREFIGWVDDTPRDEVRLLLGEEVEACHRNRMMNQVFGG